MKKLPFIFSLIFFYNLANGQDYLIKNLKINTEQSQFGLVFYNNNEVYFSAPVMNSVNLKRKKDNLPLIFSLFQGHKSKSGEIIDVELFDNLKKTSFNSSSVIISPDGRYMYLTTNSGNKKDTYKVKDKSYNLFIVRAEFIEGKGWTNFKRLPFCKPNYSYGHPALSSDGKTLYFVSNIPSARGATDIFRVSVLDNDAYGKPQNLGPIVNSVRKEMFPYVDTDGTLYLSSDRASGFGGLDIYKVTKDDKGNFKVPTLMPSPINSKYDDFAFVFKASKEEGYFSSKRPGGKGGDDIYYVTQMKESNQDFLVTVSSN